MNWTPEMVAQLRDMRSRGYGYRKMAAALSAEFGRRVSRHVVRHAVAAIERTGTVPAAPSAPAPSDAVSAERERARRKAEVEELRRLVERRAVIEEWRDALREAALTIEPPPLWREAGDCGPGDEETAVLLISDIHYGQHTPARVNAGWTQTAAVVEAQFERLAHAVLRIWDLRRRSMPWRHLVILDLGDDVEGDAMHTSQHRQVDPLVAQQTAEVGRLLAGLVQTLLQAFERITVHRVPGNHGRTTPKAGVAGLAELDPADSYDWLAGEFARAILRPAIEAGRVELHNHESYWASTEVMGHRILFEHGSSLRGGASWGGIPYYGIDRAAAAYRDLEGDYLLLALGHYHRPYMLPSGYGSWVLGNGSFAPTTPFVAGSKHRATRPCQALLSIHPRKGVTMATWLYLDVPREAQAS
ncbi:MAG: metallophosphoesterase [Bacillota bacterium]|nr:metallophosphoesterase [Bacillota bacterium]